MYREAGDEDDQAGEGEEKEVKRASIAIWEGAGAAGKDGFLFHNSSVWLYVYKLCQKHK